MIFVWIFLYGGMYLFAEQISEKIGAEHCITAFAVVLYAIALLVWSGRKSQRKICPPYTFKNKPRELVYLTPLLLFPAFNLFTVNREWNGYAILLTVGACIVEEIFFRGYLLSCFKDKQKIGALLSSGAFALLHLVNLQTAAPSFVCMQVFSAFAAGLCFCGLTLRYKSLLPATLLHLAVNLTGMGSVASTAWWYVAVAAGSLLYAIYGVYIILLGEKE